MATANRTTIVSVFDSMTDAQRAIERLVNNGIRREDISLVANDREGSYSGGMDGKDAGDGKKTIDGTGYGENIAVGTGVGALGGLLLGLGALAIPGIGPVVAAGPLAATIGGAITGAVGGGLIGALKDAGVPDDDANVYAEHVRRGGAMLTVHTDHAQADRISDILDDAGAVQVDERAEEYRSSGWNRFDPDAQPYQETDIDRQRRIGSLGTTGTGVAGGIGNALHNAKENVKDAVTPDRTRTTGTTGANLKGNNLQGERSIPVVEENIAVGKRAVERGRVRVYSHVTERPVEEQVTLHEEHARVERRPVNRPVAPGELNNLRDETIEVREMSEEAVVQKNARVVEEVIVGKESSNRTETIRDTVRRTDVEVDRGTGTTGNMGLNRDADYDTDFRNHFTSRYGNMGSNYKYETYQPAYQYGHRMASDPRYKGRRFEEIENDLRTDYTRNNPNSTWEQMKDSVRYGWDKVSGKY